MRPRPTFDPDGFIDALVVDHEDGFPVTVEPSPEPTDFALAGLHRLVDPTIPASAVPTEPAPDDDEPSTADRRWWALMTREHCPEGVPLPLYRLACEVVGLGPVGFCEGFEPHAGDWPSDTGVIPAELMPADA